MTKQDIDNLPNYAGIYLIRNKINGKCYIGQAVKLKKRLRDHWNHYTSSKYEQIALYKALRKYGIENFELKILERFTDALNWKVPRRLDELEKGYIQEYDSYNNGYNSTLGGDTGVLGYRHTEETKERLSKNSLKYQETIRQELSKDSINWIKVKNLETREILIFKTRRDLEIALNLTRYTILHCLTKQQRVASKKYQIVYYNEEFEELPEYRSEEFKTLLIGQFQTLSSKEQILEYIKESPKCTYGDISQNFTLSRKTFFNYKKELGIEYDQRVDSKVTKEDFIEYYSSHTKDECISHFSISERRYYKYIHKYLNG